MQWTYEIRGSHPHYKIPSVQGGRIENKLSKEIHTKMTTAHSQNKNFLRDNQKAHQFTKSPQRDKKKQDSISGVKRASSPTRHNKS